jgi:hypothetical protein
MPIPPLCLSLLLLTTAATTAPGSVKDPVSYESLGYLAVGLFALAAGGNQLMGLLGKFRALRQPDAGDVSTDRIKALEDKVSNIELRMERQMGTIESKLETMAKSLSQIVADFNYTIGKLDGRNSNNFEG